MVTAFIPPGFTDNTFSPEDKPEVKQGYHYCKGESRGVLQGIDNSVPGYTTDVHVNTQVHHQEKLYFCSFKIKYNKPKF